MSTDRFIFHRAAVRTALAESDLPVLQCGTNDDPAHLKDVDPERVINSDLFDYDSILDRPNLVDLTFDVARDRWPFDDQSCSLVVMGDILEHLTPEEIHVALTEARRVGHRLCITVPKDTREENNDERADTYPRGAVHRTIVTEDLLREQLDRAAWMVTDFRAIGPGFWWEDYFFVNAE
jgi:hypothetical protein